MNQLELLNQYIKESNNIVFFGGAGVSTASGIKDFRSPDGLYHEKYKYPPEKILSHSFFIKHPEDFYQFYREKLNCLSASPNVCHTFLTKLEQTGKLKAIITQNIDGLHQKAKSKNVLELHGTIYKNNCISCHKSYPPEIIFNQKKIPTCTCGNLIKPSVILYEESLDEEVIYQTINAISQADLLLVVGTSLTVYPSSSFIHYFKGKHLVIINRDTTPMDHMATLTITDDIKEVFSYLTNKRNKE
ncbi:MAG: NAD-dependent protein deacylase [Candidatus Aphodocola sp.]